MILRAQYLLLLSMLLFLCSCFDDDSFNATNFSFDELIDRVEIEKEELLANGEDQSMVRVFFANDQNIENVEFSARLENGLFNENQMSSLTSTVVVEELDSIRRFIEFNVVSPLEPTETTLIMNLNNFISRREME